MKELHPLWPYLPQNNNAAPQTSSSMAAPTGKASGSTGTGGRGHRDLCGDLVYAPFAWSTPAHILRPAAVVSCAPVGLLIYGLVWKEFHD